ncbi:MAG: hypothetical protein WAN69_04125 [Candidatus Korobacteraceae bacterium]
MSRKTIAFHACWVLFLLFASLSQAVAQANRQPLGVYAHVSIEDLLNASPPPSHADLRRLYAQVLADPAIAGLAVGRHWDNIQLSDPACIVTQSCAPGTVDGYDWSYVDDAFVEATADGKSVQLIITPGFDLPPWLAAKIPPCDGLFTVGIVIVPPDCGTVQFQHFPEDQRSDQINGHFVLPLPWNPIYQTAWWDFLGHLSARYNSNPTFISIAIAEPVGGSTEFVLPTSDNNDGKGNGNSSQDPSGTPADNTWAALIAFSFPNATYDYQNSDQVLIDQWKQTIDEYETIFSGVTLFLSPDAGADYPKFAWNTTLPFHLDNTLFAIDCSKAIMLKLDDYRSCEAKTDVLSYFVTVDGPNAKATQVGGMTASSSTSTGDIGVPGVKVLTSLSPPLLGGAEFDHPVSGSTTLRQEVGCPPVLGPNCMLSPEEAAYYVLADFFDSTPYAKYYGATKGTATIQYLEVDIQDVQYAEKYPCAPVPNPLVVQPSLQDLLNRASHDLFAMAGQTTTLPPPTCP